MASKFNLPDKARQLVTFNRIFILLCTFFMIVGAYLTKGTFYVIFPLILGGCPIIALLFNNTFLHQLNE